MTNQQTPQTKNKVAATSEHSLLPSAQSSRYVSISTFKQPVASAAGETVSVVRQQPSQSPIRRQNRHFLSSYVSGTRRTSPPPKGWGSARLVRKTSAAGRGAYNGRAGDGSSLYGGSTLALLPSKSADSSTQSLGIVPPHSLASTRRYGVAPDGNRERRSSPSDAALNVQQQPQQQESSEQLLQTLENEIRRLQQSFNNDKMLPAEEKQQTLANGESIIDIDSENNLDKQQRIEHNGNEQVQIHNFSKLCHFKCFSNKYSVVWINIF